MVEIKSKDNEKMERWENRHYEIKKIKAYDPTFSWVHLFVGRNKESGQYVLRLKKFRNYFNITSKKHLSAVRKLLELGGKEIEWSEEMNDEEINNLIKKNKDLKELKEKSRKQVRHQKETIQRLLDQVGKLREEQFFINLEGFKKDLREFRKKLREGDEKEIQEWLYEHSWVFGPKYIDNSKEEINREGDRIDFLMQRYDTFFDVFELKLPTSPVFVGKPKGNPQENLDRNFRMSAEVKDALSQIMGYLEEYELDKTNISWKKGIDVHKPKGIIVIGREKKEEKRALQTLNSYFHNLEILTYDSIVDMANNFIRLIENKQKQHKQNK